MAIPDPMIGFRAPSDTRGQLADIMRLFERDRSWVLRKAVAVFWLVLFDIYKLERFFDEWKVFTRDKQQDAVVLQLKLNFNDYKNVKFYPRLRIIGMPGEVRDED